MSEPLSDLWPDEGPWPTLCKPAPGPPKCFCPSCVPIATAACELCWERFSYVDEDGVPWNTCLTCEIMERPTKFTFPC